MTAVDFRFNEYIGKINAEKEEKERKRIEKIKTLEESLDTFKKIKICGLDKRIAIGGFSAIGLEIAALMLMSLYAIKQSIVLYGTPAFGLAFAVIFQGLVIYNIFILSAASLILWYGKKNYEYSLKKLEEIKEQIKNPAVSGAREDKK